MLKRLVFRTNRRRIFASGKYWAKQHRSHESERAYWLSVPMVTEWVNKRVSADPKIWPLSWFLLSLPQERLPVRRALSIGCGPGNLEREVIRHQVAHSIEGIDVSAHSLKLAQQQAKDAGYSGRISYHLADALSWLRKAVKGPGYDLMFFHASLHHIERLEEVLGLCTQCLRGTPGLLYVDEYIGPSRDEWTRGALGYAEALYSEIPSEYRWKRNLIPPVAFDDPTEMIRSSEIERVLRDCLEIVDYKPYYGNVLMPLVSGIKKCGLDHPQVQEVLEQAMTLEDFLVDRALIDPLHAVFVARPK